MDRDPPTPGTMGDRCRHPVPGKAWRRAGSAGRASFTVIAGGPCSARYDHGTTAATGRSSTAATRCKTRIRSHTPARPPQAHGAGQSHPRKTAHNRQTAARSIRRCPVSDVNAFPSAASASPAAARAAARISSRHPAGTGLGRIALARFSKASGFIAVLRRGDAAGREVCPSHSDNGSRPCSAESRALRRCTRRSCPPRV